MDYSTYDADCGVGDPVVAEFVFEQRDLVKEQDGDVGPRQRRERNSGMRARCWSPFGVLSDPRTGG